MLVAVGSNIPRFLPPLCGSVDIIPHNHTIVVKLQNVVLVGHLWAQFHERLAVIWVQEYKHMKAEEKAKLEGKAAH